MTSGGSEFPLHGRLHRSDVLLVGGGDKAEVLERGYDSVSSEDVDGRGLEHAFASSSEDESAALNGAVRSLNAVLADFE